MCTVEALIDEIRHCFSPNDIINVSGATPLAVKLRMLSYQLNEPLSPNSDFVQEWYEVERPKFSSAPTQDVSTTERRRQHHEKHPLVEMCEQHSHSDRNRRLLNDASRHTRRINTEHEKFVATLQARIQQRLESDPADSLTDDESSEDEGILLQQKFDARRARQAATLKEERRKAEEHLQAVENAANDAEGSLEQRRAARRARLEMERQREEKLLEEQEAFRKRRQETLRKRQERLESEAADIEIANQERIAAWRQRQDAINQRRQEEYIRREAEWSSWEAAEELRRADEKRLREEEAEEFRAIQEQARVAAEQEAERSRQAEEAEINEYVQQELTRERLFRESAGIIPERIDGREYNRLPTDIQEGEPIQLEDSSIAHNVATPEDQFSSANDVYVSSDQSPSIVPNEIPTSESD